jgi:hypothetical protein
MDVRRRVGSQTPGTGAASETAAPTPARPGTPAASANRISPTAVPDGFKLGAAGPARSGPASTAFVTPTQGQWTADAHTGARSDPVTIYVHGTLADVEGALEKSGWTQADPQGLSANVRYLGAAAKQEVLKAASWFAQKIDSAEIGIAGVFGLHPQPVLPTDVPIVPGVNRMPVSPQKLGDQPMLAAYQQNNNPLGGRDHLRIFDTGQKDAQGRSVFAIAASKDTGIGFSKDHPETGFLFHKVEADVDAERNRVISALSAGGRVSNVQTTKVPFGAPSKIGEYVGDSSVVEVDLSTYRPVSIPNWA